MYRVVCKVASSDGANYNEDEKMWNNNGINYGRYATILEAEERIDELWGDNEFMDQGYKFYYILEMDDVKECKEYKR